MELLNSVAVIARQEDLLTTGQGADPIPKRPWGDVWQWVDVNHAHNALLWDQEDLARRTLARAEEIAGNKRLIDRYNQVRNDAIEKMDECLLVALNLLDPATSTADRPVAQRPSTAALHSETAGAMIDRLSILALKIRAMRQQTLRVDVPAEQVQACIDRQARLQEQRQDLGGCLDSLLAQCLSGQRYFKVYRQFKMYNDARFNPALVQEQAAAAQRLAPSLAQDAPAAPGPITPARPLV